MIADHAADVNMMYGFAFLVLSFSFLDFSNFCIVIMCSWISYVSILLGGKGLLEWLVFSERYFCPLCVGVYSWVRSFEEEVKGGKSFFLEKLGFILEEFFFRSGLNHRLAL
jgi:hypothetical protein